MPIAPLNRRDRALVLRHIENELFPSPESVPAEERKDLGVKLARILDYIKNAPEVGITLSEYNAKVGDIYNFSLPAGHYFRGATCPGASRECENLCYVKTGFMAYHEWKYYANWAYVELFPTDFANAFIRNEDLPPVFRVHVGGDWFEVWYIRLWMRIMRARRDVRFFAYTRSWQNGEGKIARRFTKPLTDLAMMDNMRLVLSCDRETGIPPKNHIRGTIRAWLAENDQDMPPKPVELIFRDPDGMHVGPPTMSAYPQVEIESSKGEILHRGATRAEGGTPVCPTERIKPDPANPRFTMKDIYDNIQCQNCAWCFGAGQKAYGRRKDNLSQFDAFASKTKKFKKRGVRVDMNRRVAGMFSGFASRPQASLKGPATEIACTCDALLPCALCDQCVVCLCRCPRDAE